MDEQNLKVAGIWRECHETWGEYDHGPCCPIHAHHAYPEANENECGQRYGLDESTSAIREATQKDIVTLLNALSDAKQVNIDRLTASLTSMTRERDFSRKEEADAEADNVRLEQELAKVTEQQNYYATIIEAAIETLAEVIGFKDAEIDRLKTELADEIEQLRVQLAGCAVAAGSAADSAKNGDYGWSASYQDVLDLRLKFDSLTAELTKMKEQRDGLLAALKAKIQMEGRGGLHKKLEDHIGWRQNDELAHDMATKAIAACEGK